MLPVVSSCLGDDCVLHFAKDPFPNAPEDPFTTVPIDTTPVTDPGTVVDPGTGTDPGVPKDETMKGIAMNDIALSGYNRNQTLSGCPTCSGIKFVTQEAPPRLGDIVSDIGGVFSSAGSGLGKTLGAALADVVQSGIEKNPQSAKAIVATGAAIGVGVIVTVGLVGYLVGRKK